MEKIKLGDILNVKRGTTLSGEFYSTKGNLIRLTLGNFDYPSGGFKENKSKDDIYFIGSVKPEFILKEGDIITPLTEQVIGLLGETARIPESNKYVQSNDIGLVIPNERFLDNSYAYYLVSSPSVKKQLSSAAQQTKIRHTSPNKIKECIVWLPDLKYQHSAGEVLDSINLKIKNNIKINNELESLAKTIYDYWFLQFDFPNEEGKPYKSSGGAMVWNEELKMEIPKGWSVTKLGNLADIVTGKEDANHAVPDGKYPFFTCSNSISKCNDFKFDSKAILIAGNGDFNIKYYDGKFNAYQRTYVVTPKDDMMTGLLYFCVLKNTIRFTNASVGSIEKFITKGDVENIPIIVPNNKIGFELFNNCLNLIQNYKKENDELIELRDFLLPLLMNGQVGFKDK